MDLVKILFGWAPFYPQIRNFQHFLEAVFAVVQYGYPARSLIVIGVTGTDGKTTTTHLTGAILQEAGYKTAVISTLGALLDGKEIETGLHVTTPDAHDVQKLLRQACDSGVTHVVLETTSHGLDQHRVFGCNFKIGVLTNITHEHLDYHKTFEKYRSAKAKMFRGVKIAVLNKDDNSFDYIKRAARDAQVISYSNKEPATLRVQKAGFRNEGTEFVVSDNRKSFKIYTGLVGDYNVYNILAAAGAARGLNIPWDKITKAVAGFGGITGRMQEVENRKGFRVFVDFAHTPGAYEQLLRTLNKVKEKGSKLITVFGAPGQRDKNKRPMMGKVAAEFSDFMILTTDDPRHENPEQIIDEITRGIRQDAKVWDGQANWRSRGRWVIRVIDRGEAIAFAIQKLAKKGDIVAILGLGHSTTIPIGDREIPWSDQEAAKVALSGKIKKLNHGYN